MSFNYLKPSRVKNAKTKMTKDLARLCITFLLQNKN